MQISHLTGTGKREHNEDSFLSLEDLQIYVVCDGVGGAAKGEVASRLCCESFDRYFSQKANSLVTDEKIKEAIKAVEKTFDEYHAIHPEAAGMGTTLAFVSLKGDQAIVAHAGDSRVYQIRDGKILFVTKDHSLVNDMVASGFIKQEDAVNHPKKNQITRAIQGTGTSVKADISHLTGIMPGDFLFLCSDGILESVSTEFIEKEFRNNPDTEVLKNKMGALCAAGSKDNYTCIIVKTGNNEIKATTDNLNAANSRGTEKRKKNSKLIWVLLFVLLAGGGYFAYSEWQKRNKADENNLPDNNEKQAPTKDQVENSTGELKNVSTPASAKKDSGLSPVAERRAGQVIDEKRMSEPLKVKEKLPAKEVPPADTMQKAKRSKPAEPKPVIQHDSLDQNEKDSLPQQ